MIRRPMPEGRFDREFVRAALVLAARGEVDRLLVVSDHPLQPQEIRGRPIKRKLVYAVTTDALASQLAAKKYQTVAIPPYDYSRVEKIKVALVACQSEGLVKEGDTILALAGHGPERNLDTLVRIRLGDEEDGPSAWTRSTSAPSSARRSWSRCSMSRWRSARRATRATPPGPSWWSATPSQ